MSKPKDHFEAVTDMYESSMKANLTQLAPAPRVLAEKALEKECRGLKERYAKALNEDAGAVYHRTRTDHG